MSSEQKNIYVAMATDDNYAYHLSVVVASVLKNISIERDLVLYVLHDELSEENKNKIKQLGVVRQFIVNFIKVDCAKYGNFKSTWNKHANKLTYARFDLGKMLPTIPKCLYLDCDVVVREDISKLYDVDITSYYFGAIEEPEETRIRQNKGLGIPDNYGYLNAGVLLLNLDMIRKIDFANMTADYVETNNYSLRYGDQDALNALFYDKWLALPLKWNVITGVCFLGENTRYLNYKKEEIIEAIRNPSIVHFTQKYKPDSFLCMHPFANEYWEYLKITPWANSVVLKDKTVKNQVRKVLYKIKHGLRRIPSFKGLREIKRRLSGYYYDK